MRTTKRFTPDVLERFRRQERGLGTYMSYTPWHRVGRSDPSSRGRSHLVMWRGRQRELLSDLELVGFCFAVMTVSDRDDIREQFPLALERSHHELSAYDARHTVPFYEGTREIADRLGIKHPRINGSGRSVDWVMTSDLLLTQRDGGSISLLAIAFKHASDLGRSRTQQLLSLEREYWSVRGVRWLLITPDLYDQRLALALRCTLPWGLGVTAPMDAVSLAAQIIVQNDGESYIKVLSSVMTSLGDMELAQRSLWQAVWSGQAPVDMRRGWRPHLPLRILPRAEFNRLNPVLSRRCATWI